MHVLPARRLAFAGGVGSFNYCTPCVLPSSNWLSPESIAACTAYVQLKTLYTPLDVSDFAFLQSWVPWVGLQELNRECRSKRIWNATQVSCSAVPHVITARTCCKIGQQLLPHHRGCKYRLRRSLEPPAGWIENNRPSVRHAHTVLSRPYLGSFRLSRFMNFDFVFDQMYSCLCSKQAITPSRHLPVNATPAVTPRCWSCIVGSLPDTCSQ